MKTLPILSHFFSHTKISEHIYVISYWALSPDSLCFANYCFITLVYWDAPYFLIRSINWGSSSNENDDSKLFEHALKGHSRCVKALCKTRDFLDANILLTPAWELIEQGRKKVEQEKLSQNKPLPT